MDCFVAKVVEKYCHMDQGNDQSYEEDKQVELNSLNFE